MRAFSIFTFFASLLILSSCQKDESSGGTPKTKTELITSSSWRYNDAKIDTDNNGLGDQPIPPGFIEACQIDNTITFATSGSGNIDEGPNKCDAADPQTLPFTWNFTTNETMINFSSALIAGIGGEFKIVSLTETELVLSKSVAILPAPIPAMTVIASFKH